MEQEKIGKFIASCRKEQGFTQAVLAEKLGITDRAVSKWETGRSLSISAKRTKNHRKYGGFLLYTRFLHDCVQYLHCTFFLSWVEVRVGIPCH